MLPRSWRLTATLVKTYRLSCTLHLAPEELSTPDPTSFPDDILTYLTTTPQEARATYDADLLTHVTSEILAACPAIMELVQSDLAYEVFVQHT